jgi:hypothetical protein
LDLIERTVPVERVWLKKPEKSMGFRVRRTALQQSPSAG